MNNKFVYYKSVVTDKLESMLNNVLTIYFTNIANRLKICLKVMLVTVIIPNY